MEQVKESSGPSTVYLYFSEICRICLNPGKLISLLESEHLQSFIEISNIQVTANSRLPTNICEGCYHELSQAVSFITRAKINNRFILDLENDIEENNIKKEQEKETTRNNTAINSCTIVGDITMPNIPFGMALTTLKVAPENDTLKPPKCMQCLSVVKDLDEHFTESQQCFSSIFNCAYCDSFFDDLFMYNSHLNCHVSQDSTNNTQTLLPSENTNKESVETYSNKIPQKETKIDQDNNNNPTTVDSLESEITKNTSAENHEELQREYWQQNTPKIWSCKKCKKPYLDVKQHHIESSLCRPTCRFCKFQTLSENNLIDHEVRHAERNSNKCPKCLKFFSKRTELQLHFANNNCIAVTQIVQDSNEDKAKKLLICHCGKKLNTMKGFLAHLLKHKHAKKKFYVCTFCDDTFSTMRLLINHSASHATKEYVCNICTKRFMQLNQFNLHLQLHKLAMN